MQAILSLYFLTVLIGGAVILCRAALRDLPRIGAALEKRPQPTAFWSNLAVADTSPRSVAIRRNRVPVNKAEVSRRYGQKDVQPHIVTK